MFEGLLQHPKFQTLLMFCVFAVFMEAAAIWVIARRLRWSAKLAIASFVCWMPVVVLLTICILGNPILRQPDYREIVPIEEVKPGGGAGLRRPFHLIATFNKIIGASESAS